MIYDDCLFYISTQKKLRAALRSLRLCGEKKIEQREGLQIIKFANPSSANPQILPSNTLMNKDSVNSFAPNLEKLKFPISFAIPLFLVGLTKFLTLNVYLTWQ